MSLTIKQHGRRDTRVADYDKQAVSLGLDVAKLKAEKDKMRRDIAFLTSFRTKVLKDVTYDENGELRKLDGSFEDYDKLMGMADDLKKEIGTLTQKKEQLSIDIEPLQKKYSETIQGLEKKITVLQVNKASLESHVRNLTSDIETHRSIFNDVQKSLKEVEESFSKTKKLVEVEMKKLSDRESVLKEKEELLTAKAKDLKVYERRIRRAFEKQFPGQKMRLIDDPLE